MEWFSRPRLIKGLIFDMDNTLYTNAAYTRHQEDVLVERLAKVRGQDMEACRRDLDAWRAEFSSRNQGRKPSLGNAFLGLGIPISTSIEWRSTLISPESYLEPDPELRTALEQLASSFRMSVVTNNPVATARRTFRVMGLEGMFPAIVGLDTFGVSKPDPRAFAHAAELMGCQAAAVLSIGDRLEIDIEPALGLGMGGLLVHNVGEVRSLPTILMDQGHI